MSEALSGRALATALGVNEKAVRKAVEAGRIAKGEDGKFDLNACRQAWGKSTDPARSKVRASADPADPPSPQFAVRTELPPVGTDALWDILAEVVTTLPWSTVAEGGSLQLAFDVHADFVLNLTGILRLRRFAEPPVFFDRIDWRVLAKEYGAPYVDPKRMHADWDRRRTAPD